MKITRVKDYQELSLVAAERISNVVNKNPNATLGLATGSTPVATYENLIKIHKEGKVSFQDVKSFNLDEYLGLERNHSESYYTFMHEKFFNHIDIKEENVHIPLGNSGDDVKACKDYNDLISNAVVDLQLLGIGVNGHIGFNEPGTSFEEETHIVNLTEETKESNKRFFSSIEEVPTEAITLGIKNIMEAENILLLISGKSKSETVKKLLSGEISEDFPASVLHNHKNVEVIIDDAAYSDID